MRFVSGHPLRAFDWSMSASGPIASILPCRRHARFGGDIGNVDTRMNRLSVKAKGNAQ
jgi:hypothetical protein